jgi:hypothetical protein
VKSYLHVSLNDTIIWGIDIERWISELFLGGKLRKEGKKVKEPKGKEHFEDSG